nr:ATP synthase F0 subunit 8 [Leptomithrax sp. QNL-2021]
MPQMAPLMWVSLFIFFTLSLTLFFFMIYYNTFFHKSHFSQPLNKNLKKSENFN